MDLKCWCTINTWLMMLLLLLFIAGEMINWEKVVRTEWGPEGNLKTRPRHMETYVWYVQVHTGKAESLEITVAGISGWWGWQVWIGVMQRQADFRFQRSKLAKGRSPWGWSAGAGLQSSTERIFIRMKSDLYEQEQWHGQCTDSPESG